MLEDKIKELFGNTKGQWTNIKELIKQLDPYMIIGSLGVGVFIGVSDAYMITSQRIIINNTLSSVLLYGTIIANAIKYAGRIKQDLREEDKQMIKAVVESYSDRIRQDLREKIIKNLLNKKLNNKFYNFLTTMLGLSAGALLGSFEITCGYFLGLLVGYTIMK